MCFMALIEDGKDIFFATILCICLFCLIVRHFEGSTNSNIDERLSEIEKEVLLIKTVLIVKDIMPYESKHF